jgi:hypothetical protein
MFSYILCEKLPENLNRNVIKPLVKGIMVLNMSASV